MTYTIQHFIFGVRFKRGTTRIVCRYKGEISSEQGFRKGFLKDITLDVTKISLEVERDKKIFQVKQSFHTSISITF